MGIAHQVWLFCCDLLPYVIFEGVTIYAHALPHLASLATLLSDLSLDQTQQASLLQNKTLIKQTVEFNEIQ